MMQSYTSLLDALLVGSVTPAVVPAAVVGTTMYMPTLSIVLDLDTPSARRVTFAEMADELVSLAKKSQPADEPAGCWDNSDEA